MARVTRSTLTLTPEQRERLARVEKEWEAMGVLHVRNEAPRLEVSVQVLDENGAAIGEPMRQTVVAAHNLGSTAAAYCFPAINRIFADKHGDVRKTLAAWWATKIQEVIDG